MAENILVNNFMSMYLYEFKMTIAICSGVHSIHEEEYLSTYGKDIYNYMVDKSSTEVKWVDTLFFLVKGGSPSPSAREHTKFMYNFLLRIYRIDGYTDMTEFKNSLHIDYKRAVRG